jgi:hypothetical protein
MHKFLVLVNTFSYTPDPTNPHDHVAVTLTTNTPDLTELLTTMENYLRATGFCFKGHLEIVEDES